VVKISKVSDIKNDWADREAIKQCLYRYCRGVDRVDMDMVRSAYWPGAMDYHTGFTGTVEGFIEWAGPRLGHMKGAHMISNVLIEMNGDTAKVESYFWSIAVVAGGKEIMATGRYLDKFEKRNDEWRIAERFVNHDWFRESDSRCDWAVGPFGMAGLEVGKPGKDDKSYSYLGW
jgi:ketosteroid isomerase-like protein